VDVTWPGEDRLTTLVVASVGDTTGDTALAKQVTKLRGDTQTRRTTAMRLMVDALGCRCDIPFDEAFRASLTIPTYPIRVDLPVEKKHR